MKIRFLSKGGKMGKETLQHANLKFQIKAKDTVWDVVHNLEDFGLSIEAAFTNWSVRTDTYTVDDFIEYVKSKDPTNIICLTLERYKELEREVEEEEKTKRNKHKK